MDVNTPNRNPTGNDVMTRTVGPGASGVQKKPVKRIVPIKATQNLLYSNFLKDFPSLKASRIVGKQISYEKGTYDRDYNPNVLARIKIAVKFWNTQVAPGLLERYKARLPDAVNALAYQNKVKDPSFKEEDQTTFQVHINAHERAGVDVIKPIFYYACSTILDEQEEDDTGLTEDEQMEREIKKEKELIFRVIYRYFLVELLLLCVYFSNKKENGVVIDDSLKNADFFNIFPIDPYLEDAESNKSNEDDNRFEDDQKEQNEDDVYKKNSRPKTDTLKEMKEIQEKLSVKLLSDVEHYLDTSEPFDYTEVSTNGMTASEFVEKFEKDRFEREYRTNPLQSLMWTLRVPASEDRVTFGEANGAPGYGADEIEQEETIQEDENGEMNDQEPLEEDKPDAKGKRLLDMDISDDSEDEWGGDESYDSEKEMQLELEEDEERKKSESGETTKKSTKKKTKSKKVKSTPVPLGGDGDIEVLEETGGAGASSKIEIIDEDKPVEKPKKKKKKKKVEIDQSKEAEAGDAMDLDVDEYKLFEDELDIVKQPDLALDDDQGSGKRVLRKKRSPFITQFLGAVQRLLKEAKEKPKKFPELKINEIEEMIDKDNLPYELTEEYFKKIIHSSLFKYMITVDKQLRDYWRVDDRFRARLKALHLSPHIDDWQKLCNLAYEANLAAKKTDIRYMKRNEELAPGVVPAPSSDDLEMDSIIYLAYLTDVISEPKANLVAQFGGDKHKTIKQYKRELIVALKNREQGLSFSAIQKKAKTYDKVIKAEDEELLYDFKQECLAAPEIWDVYSALIQNEKTVEFLSNDPSLGQYLSKFISKEVLDDIDYRMNNKNRYTLMDILSDKNNQIKDTATFWNFFQDIGFRYFLYSTPEFIYHFEEFEKALDGVIGGYKQSVADAIRGELKLLSDALAVETHPINEAMKFVYPILEVSKARTEAQKESLLGTHLVLLPLVKQTVFKNIFVSMPIDESDDSTAFVVYKTKMQKYDKVEGASRLAFSRILDNVAGHDVFGILPNESKLREADMQIAAAFGVLGVVKKTVYDAEIPPLMIFTPWKSYSDASNYSYGREDNIATTLLTNSEFKEYYRHNFIVVVSTYQLIKRMTAMFVHYNFRYDATLKDEEAAQIAALRPDPLAEYASLDKVRMEEAATLFANVANYEETTRKVAKSLPATTIFGKFFVSDEEGWFAEIATKATDVLLSGSRRENQQALPLAKIGYENVQTLWIEPVSYEFDIEAIREKMLTKIWKGEIFNPFTLWYKPEISAEYIKKKMTGKTKFSTVLSTYYKAMTNAYVDDSFLGTFGVSPSSQLDTEMLGEYIQNYFYFPGKSKEQAVEILRELYAIMSRNLSFILYTRTNTAETDDDGEKKDKKSPTRAKTVALLTMGLLKIMMKYYNPFIAAKVMEESVTFVDAPMEGKVIETVLDMLEVHESMVSKIAKPHKTRVEMSAMNLNFSDVGVRYIPKAANDKIFDEIAVKELKVTKRTDDLSLKQMSVALEWMRVNTLHGQIMNSNLFINKSSWTFDVKPAGNAKKSRRMIYQLVMRRLSGDWVYSYPVKYMRVDIGTVVSECARFMSFIKASTAV